MLVGLPHRPLLAGNGGRERGSPRPPSSLRRSAQSLHRRPPKAHKDPPCGLPGQMTDLSPVLPENRPISRAWPMAIRKGADRDGILGAAVDIPLRRPDGISRNNHAFDDRMWVTFSTLRFTERTRIAFICIADQVPDRRQPGRQTSTLGQSESLPLRARAIWSLKSSE